MSELITVVIIAVVFLFVGFVCASLLHERQWKTERRMKLEYGISSEINCAKELRAKKTDDALVMMERKIYNYLWGSMIIKKKGAKYISLLDFNQTSPQIIEAWQQSKEYFKTYGMDTIRKDAEQGEIWTEFFKLFQEKLKEVPLTFKEKYMGNNPMPALEPEFDIWDDPPVTLKQLRGKVVLMNIWALGCLPCKQMMPELQKLNEKYADKGLEIISIAPPCKNEKQVADFFSEKNYTFRKEIASSKTWTIYPIHGVPTNFLIDKNGYLAEGPTHELPEASVIEKILAV